jgi:hypothetical protein
MPHNYTSSHFFHKAGTIWLLQLGTSQYYYRKQDVFCHSRRVLMTPNWGSKTVVQTVFLFKNAKDSSLAFAYDQQNETLPSPK